MSATVPITNGQMSAGALSTQPLGSPAEAPPEGLTVQGPHNTSLHVGLWALGAIGFIAFFHLGGFRIAFDVGMGRG